MTRMEKRRSAHRLTVTLLAITIYTTTKKNNNKCNIEYIIHRSTSTKAHEVCKWSFHADDHLQVECLYHVAGVSMIVMVTAGYLYIYVNKSFSVIFFIRCEDVLFSFYFLACVH